jgi:hypothetical protein
VLVILAHATAPSDPSEGAFDDPGETHNLERPLTAFDDAKLVASALMSLVSLRLWWPASALIVGKIGPRPPSKRAAVRRFDMLAASTRLAIGKMAFTTARTSMLRGRPPGFPSGIIESTNAHCASVKSVAYVLIPVSKIWSAAYALAY